MLCFRCINAFVHIFKSNLDKAGNDNMSDAKGVNTQLNRAPTIGNPTVSRVASSTSELTITATATDEDEGDVLTYKLLRGTSANDASLIELALTPEKIEGRTVTFKDTGLSMDTYYWYKIKVSDGIDDNISGNYGSERTYCLGSFCAGGGYNQLPCTNSNCNNGQVNCTNSSCNNGKVICTVCKGKGKVLGGKCPDCDGDGYKGGSYIYNGMHNSQGLRCRWCNYKTNNWTFARDPELGINVGDYAECPSCGSMNFFPAYESGIDFCSCNGIGKKILNCTSCVDGYSTCSICGGDRKDELQHLSGQRIFVRSI